MWSIGVDPHKRMCQLAALGAAGEVVQQQLPNTPAGWQQALAWAARWPERRWAIEGSGALGRGLAQALLAAGERVYEVSPRWTAQVRRSARKPGKSDALDALAVARLAREQAGSLPAVQPEDEVSTALALLSGQRDRLIQEQTCLINQLRGVLHQLDPVAEQQLPVLTSAAGQRAAQAIMTAAGGGLDALRARLAGDLLERLDLLMRQQQALQASLAELTRRHAGPLLRIAGVGVIVAAGLLAELGQPRPGFGPPQLAMLAGLAPLEASSSGLVRHRLNRGGNRRLNRLFHTIMLTQSRSEPRARAYLARRQAEGKTLREAQRALKRQLVGTVYRHWLDCWPPCQAAA